MGRKNEFDAFKIVPQGAIESEKMVARLLPL